MNTTDTRPGPVRFRRGSRRHHAMGFWAVAFTFLTLAAFTTVPSPLYGLYQARDGFSTFTLTVVFAAYAVGVIGALAFAGHLSDWYGRRRLLIPAAAFTVASALVFLTWTTVPGLLLARVLSGISIGLAQSTATAYLAELHAKHLPHATPGRAQVTATTVNMGGLGVGALVAGLLSQQTADALTLPYVVFLIAALAAGVAVALSPETREPLRPRPRYRPQRPTVPAEARGEYYAASLSAMVVFATIGLFAGLAGLFLAVELGQPSHVLLGSALFAVFTAGVAAQLLTLKWPVRRVLATGMALMVAGLMLVVTAMWLPAPSLVLFLLGGVLSGAGGGQVFKGAVGTVISVTPPETRAGALTGTYLAAFIGLSVPIVGAGIVLALGVSPRATLLGFALAVALGIAAAAVKLLPRQRGTGSRAGIAHRTHASGTSS